MEYTPALIESIVSSDKVCPHLHVPLQSGSDRILIRMNRPYTLREYRDLLERLRQRIPNLAVTTDIIAGFPGETEDDHASTLEFVKACGFSGINVFPYSNRKGTPAADFPDQVPKQLKAQRVKDLLLAARVSQEEFVRCFLGKPVEVLIEWIDQQGCAIGYTPQYIQVKIPSSEDVLPWASRRFVTVVLKEEMVGWLIR
jgi:threonylcarbamoyladenosine tRNA methylthiotransferase MtaB